ncbi:MAG TPA: DUF4350 domain-containing protein [Verrucomicrobiae bacterium]|nr:DUF4350 domain-containing protein [Verrucomicrobiae bacterium]
MIRALNSHWLPWLGLWLVASSWLFGEDYFVKAQPSIWVAIVAAGTILVCLSQFARQEAPSDPPADSATEPRHAVLPPVMVLCLVPAAIVLPWPSRIAPLLLACGALLEFSRRRFARAFATGVSLAGTILLVQSLALAIYKHATARSHDLPWPLPSLLACVLRLLGTDAAADGSDLVLFTMRANHRLGATWELFLDPATVCFIAGGLAMVVLGLAGRTNSTDDSAAVRSRRREEADRQIRNPKSEIRNRTRLLKSATTSPAVKAAGVLLVATALWLPLRAGILAGTFLHRALRTEFEAPLNLMNQFWSPWPQFLLLLPLAMLAARWLRNFPVRAALAGLSPASPRRSLVRTLSLGFVTAAVWTLAIHWDPVGKPKQGRVAVDEFHSTWEPTGRPMDTEWYGHLSGYNYACLYDYCSRYYTMSRLTNTFTDATLAALDVLILKVPTERYQPAEIDAVVRFVGRGGSVLFIGEHTDVFNTGYYLNSITRRFGFEFRYDCLFGVESFFDQFYKTPLVRHPVLQHLREFDFATSCSLDVRGGSGRGVIVSTGLKNSMADYHANNYYPQAVDHAAMRSGAFVQLWAARHDRGRLLAFTDSTIFSNFSAFEPGKAELFLGMIEWLNRQDRLGNPRLILLLVGAVLSIWTLWSACKLPGAARLTLATAVFGWGATSLALLAHQRQALSEPRPVRPLTWVTIDRAVCDSPLSKGGFIAGKADGFGIFERWILRLGYFIKRRVGLDAAQGNLVVFFYPTRPVSSDYRDALVRYVERGGKLLILDSPMNEQSTAAALLELFQLSRRPLPAQKGMLSNTAGWPAVPVDAAHEIVGGQALFYLDGKPVGAIARRGKGAVVALGFGSRFADPSMGVTGDVVPDTELRKVFDLDFVLLRAIIQDQLPAAAPVSN